MFTIPSYVTRLHVDANYGGSCENFIARANGSSFVNTILGSCSVASGRSFTGTYVVPGGATISIVGSPGVNWLFYEVR